jgi:tRNA(Arg) A34 adenosine deaminase TadA
VVQHRRNPDGTIGIASENEESLMHPTVSLTLPSWVSEEVGEPERTFSTLDGKMELVIRLAEGNISKGTGGPFGAGVFDMERGTLVAPGVNIVVTADCSVAHAEAMAIMLAQQAHRTFDLAGRGLPAMELVTSAQPCIQCFGMIWWSGVRRVVTGASGEDVQGLTGFEEGPLPRDWIGLLANRPPLHPVEVVTGCLRSQACEVLRKYRESGGPIYNPGSTRTS